MVNDAPCKGCERRSVLCHAKCGEYQMWKSELDELNEAKRKEHRPYQELVSMHVDTAEKIRRSKG